MLRTLALPWRPGREEGGKTPLLVVDTLLLAPLCSPGTEIVWGGKKVSPPLRADRSSTGLTEPSSSSLDSPGKFTFSFGRGNYYRRTTNGTLYYLQVDGVYGHAGRGLPFQFRRSALRRG